MAVISKLAVALTANTGQFAKKMSGATKTVKAFGSSVVNALTGTTAKLAGLFTAITGVAGIAGMGLLIKNTAEAIDTTAKLADTLGETTANLVGLQHAANLGGASTEELAKSLTFLQKTIGKTLTAEAKEALDMLGLSVEQLAGKRPSEQLSLIADALKNVGSQERKTAIAAALLGRSGIALLPTLAAGSAGLREMAQEAIDLGAAFTRVDAAKIEVANDNVSRLKLALTGLAQQATIALSGPFAALSNLFVQMAKDGIKSSKDLGQGYSVVGDSIAKIIGSLQRGWNNLRLVGAATLRSLATLRNVVTLGLDQEMADRLVFAAERIEKEVGESMADIDITGGFAAQFERELAKVEAAAADTAAKLEADLSMQNSMRGLSSAFAGAVESGVAQGLEWARMAPAEEKFGLDMLGLGNLAGALDVRSEFMRNELPTIANPIVSASAGTRGTFASESAGRMAGTFTIQQKQLDALESIADATQETADFIKGGVPAP